MEITLNADNIGRIFILEDCPERVEWFKSIFVPFNIEVVVTHQTGRAIEILSQTKFDLIFLDHDLEDEYYCAPHPYTEQESPEELTGLYVAKKLRDTVNQETSCIIHSMNPVGSAKMLEAHPFNTYHVPFHLLKDNLRLVSKDEKA